VLIPRRPHQRYLTAPQACYGVKDAPDIRVSQKFKFGIMFSRHSFFLWSPILYGIPKVEEKRKKFSLRKPRKPGEREKYFAPFFEIFHTKREKTFL
jgi:hypothetical protein